MSAYGHDEKNEPAGPDETAPLTGDWDGRRTAWRDQGLALDIGYRFDILAQLNDSKCSKALHWLDQLDIRLGLDTEKLFGWTGTQAFLHVIGNHGDKPAIEAGRLPHGLDNIEVPEGADGFKVFHAWLEKRFGDSGLAAKLGLYGVDSEFYVTESSDIYQHPTYGVGAEFAGTGRNGPSIFPYSAFALRLKYAPHPTWYAQAAVMDGVPGNPDHPKSTRIDLEDGDGLLSIAEVGYHAEPSEGMGEDKLALGAWSYSRRFDDLLELDAGGNPVQNRSRGVYLLAEKRLWDDAAQPQRHLMGFLRAGRNDGDTTQFNSSWSTGLTWYGPLAGRASDQFGIAFSQENNSLKWRTAAASTIRHEKAYEATYRARVKPWLHLQPFVQYLVNHGTDPTQDRTWWAGMRIEAEL